uniref:Uncharacterized protein n=1 Tax=Ditylenchus dipsaci TaxID=166011 RepID=A0A915E7T8_9BILA
MFVYFLLPETKNKLTDAIAAEIRTRSKTISFTRHNKVSTKKRASLDEKQRLILSDSEVGLYKYLSLRRSIETSNQTETSTLKTLYNDSRESNAFLIS